MKRRIAALAAAAVAFLLLGGGTLTPARGEEWKGVDDTVMEKMARDAGRPPSKPLINMDQGDILIGMFLLAGAAGGFVVGYNFRNLFGPGSPLREKNES